MKFYRVSYSKEGGNHGGFTWHTSRAEAVATARKDYELDPSEYDFHASIGASIEARIDTINITPTRAGILHALRRYADHPDNG